MALVFPVVWRFVDIYGVAKIDLTFDDIVRNKVVRVTVILCASMCSCAERQIVRDLRCVVCLCDMRDN